MFWRRWHISLSSWLRDYLYIPLGGNRRGIRMTYRNLLLTMVLGGLWHGAAWTFVVWGTIHGVALAINKAFSDWRKRTNNGVAPTPTTGGVVVSTIATFLLVCLAWIFFRATTFGDAWTVLTNFVTLSGDGSAEVSRWIIVYLIASAILHTMAWKKLLQPRIDALSDERLGAALGIGTAVALTLLPVASAPFIYFQF